MTIDQRVAEASALRRFFQEQWDQLQQLLEAHRVERAGQEREALAIAGAVESIVEGTDRRLRVVADYKRALRDSAHQLLDYVDEIVQQMPPALLVNRANLANDPMVKRLVRNRDHLRQLFQHNRLIQRFFDDPRHSQCEEVFALLFVMRYEKTVLGSEVRGDMVIHDVRQTAVNFTAREVIAPQPSETDARNAVRQVLFDSVINYAKRQLLLRRESQSREQQLSPELSLKNPRVYLNLLTELLSVPRQLLRFSNDQLNVNAMDIRLSPSDEARADTLHLYEVGVGDEPSRVISIVRYARSEFEMGG